MASGTMATSQWVQFFTDAGIPPGPALSYALTFVDNRIQRSMLLDLTKEIINELGITVVGDVIAILKHAKAVHSQELCQAASELLSPGPSAPQAELRRGTTSAASRMIANSLSREAPPTTTTSSQSRPCPSKISTTSSQSRPCPSKISTTSSQSRPCPSKISTTSSQSRPCPSKISITVSNTMAAARTGEAEAGASSGLLPAKRHRAAVGTEGTAEGTGSGGRRILQEQAAKALPRASVFQRLGAEAWPEPAEPGKPRGVFSRLGASSVPTPEGEEEEDEDPAALPYKGVLKPSPAASHSRSGPGAGAKPGAGSAPLGPAAAAQDGAVSSSQRRLRVTIRREPAGGCGVVSSSSDLLPCARMDGAGAALSVFRRLGRKPE